MQPQNKGPGMLWGRSYVTPMMSRDVIGMIGGWGVSQRIQSWQLSHDYFANPSQTCMKLSEITL